MDRPSEKVVTKDDINVGGEGRVSTIRPICVGWSTGGKAIPKRTVV